MVSLRYDCAHPPLRAQLTSRTTGKDFDVAAHTFHLLAGSRIEVIPRGSAGAAAGVDARAFSAPTPSNAAELVVDRADNFRTRIERASARLVQVLRYGAERRKQQADRLSIRLRQWPVRVVMRDRDRHELMLRLGHAMRHRVGRHAQRFDALRRRLERRDVRRVTADLTTRIVRADGRLRELVTARRLAWQARVRALAAQLDAMSPLAVLGRGYAVCWNESRTSIIRSAQAVEPGEAVRVTLAEGELTCRVQETTSGVVSAEDRIEKRHPRS